MKHRRTLNILLVATIGIVMLLTAGCAETLVPQTSYQGRLMDQFGTPLNGTVDLTIRLYHSESGGEAVHTETHTGVDVEDGLFDLAIGPTGLGSVSPEDMTQPLWMEVTVDDGTYSEILTPRQRLLGSPYAFTLMPGSVISGTMDTIIYGTEVDAVVTIRNDLAYDSENPPLPALRVVGDSGLEIANLPDGREMSVIRSDSSRVHGDLHFFSGDEIWFYLDRENDSTSEFRVYGGDGTAACRINENGDLECAGTKSAVVNVEDQPRLMYAIESTEVWFEDIGSSSLRNGMAVVEVDPIFISTVQMSADYHVFLTPLGDCKGLYVAKKTETGFEVHEIGNGTSNVGFDYRIVAHRAGYEHLRMELSADFSDGQELDLP